MMQGNLLLPLLEKLMLLPELPAAGTCQLTGELHFKFSKIMI